MPSAALVDLQIKDVEKEIQKLQRAQESGNNASTDDYKGGYKAGVMVGMKAVLADETHTRCSSRLYSQ